MSTGQIFLILISGLGVLHGLLLALFLWIYPKGLKDANRLISLLLIILSFRIGKSVLLEFTDRVYIQVIFLGLAAMLLIGPLFYLYVRTVTHKGFYESKSYLRHFAPFVVAFFFSIWINNEHIKALPKAFFIGIFCLYYGQFLTYLFLSFRSIKALKQQQSENTSTIEWLNLLLYALTGLWIIYVLNLIEDKVPYVLGPILYSVIAYGVSYIAIRKGYISQLTQVKYKTTPVSEADTDSLFFDIDRLINDELYKDTELSLQSLSKLLKQSPQKVSMVINTRSGTNFNGFVNQYRIKKAQHLLLDKAYKNYTIAAIAFEVGFNSLASFNTSFKKVTQTTPSAFRKGNTSAKA
jgi:AraC-like DNA-binding protein